MFESLFNKVAGLKAYNFVKKRLQQRLFPVSIAKFLRTTLFIEHLRWLLLFKEDFGNVVIKSKFTINRNTKLFFKATEYYKSVVHFLGPFL